MNQQESQIAKITLQLQSLSPLQLTEVDRFVSTLVTAQNPELEQSPTIHPNWPHAPSHRLSHHGAYIVTAGTLYKKHLFCSASLLNYLQLQLLEKAMQYEWSIEAWACFSNHYHFVAQPLKSPDSLVTFLTHLHSDTARYVNELNGTLGRQVWHNYRETMLTFEKSYLARLNYVHQNAVHHRLVPTANQYPWCSAAWFERSAPLSQVKTIYSFKTDKIRIDDDYDTLECCDLSQL
jgi:putative transposase